MPSVYIDGNTLTFQALERAKIIDTKKSEKFNFNGCKSIHLISNNGGGIDTVTSSDLYLMGGTSKPKGKCSGIVVNEQSACRVQFFDQLESTKCSFLTSLTVT